MRICWVAVVRVIKEHFTFKLLAPINGSSDTTYRVAAAITQFAGGSTKYFDTNHADLKPKKDPACELNRVNGHLTSAPILELQ